MSQKICSCEGCNRKVRTGKLYPSGASSLELRRGNCRECYDKGHYMAPKDFQIFAHSSKVSIKKTIKKRRLKNLTEDQLLESICEEK